VKVAVSGTAPLVGEPEKCAATGSYGVRESVSVQPLHGMCIQRLAVCPNRLPGRYSSKVKPIPQ